MKRFIFITLLAACCAMAVSAQKVPAMQMPRIPADTAIRVGKLPNGMTYYVRHNAKPEGQAEFFILTHVGAMQEDTTQIGLAHFLEHMAFNGTKNFPGHGIESYTASIGVKFGTNLNAVTGQEYTCYNMSGVPLLREGIVDSCLMILHDWTYFITLDPKEVDDERGVIIEELRQGNNAQWRINQAQAPYIFNKTRYAWRNVIGNEAGLRSFDRKELVDFYHRWYRTDMQAVVVVGDFNPDEMVEKIRRVMADVPAVTDPQPKQVVAIPDNREPLISVDTDPEQTSTSVTIYTKYEPTPREMNNTVPMAYVDLSRRMVSVMFNMRMRELTKKPDAPFLSASMAQGMMTETCDVMMVRAEARDGQAARTLEALYTELERMRRHGFTQSELERVQSELMRAARRQYDNRGDRRSRELVDACLLNFRMNTAMPSAEYEFRLDSVIISTANLTTINAMCKELVTPDNRVILVSAPEKAGAPVPSRGDVTAIMSRVDALELTPWADATVIEPLVSAPLKGSRVIKSETDKLGDTVWTLSNGVRVVLRQTDFKADELLMTINSTGGLSMLGNEDYPSGERLSSLVASSGVGKFSATQLERQLAGKAARVQPAISDYENGFSGACSPKDLETMLQLVWLYFNSPRFDQGDFDVMMDKYASALANAGSNPSYLFQKRMMETVYGNHPRRRAVTAESLKEVDFKRMEPIYRKLYSNAAAFTYTFVGNIDPVEAKPLIEKYLGSLPVSKEKLVWQNDNAGPLKGRITDRFEVPMQNPKSTVAVYLTGDMPFSLENAMLCTILDQILDLRYTKSIREEKGGTYGVSAQISARRIPVQGFRMTISFDTSPAMVDELLPIVTSEIEKIAKEGPLAEDLSKVREFMVKQRAENLKRNGAWLSWIDTYYANGYDPTTDYEAILAGVTPEKIQALAARILAAGNDITVVMSPKN